MKDAKRKKKKRKLKKKYFYRKYSVLLLYLSIWTDSKPIVWDSSVVLTEKILLIKEHKCFDSVSLLD